MAIQRKRDKEETDIEDEVKTSKPKSDAEPKLAPKKKAPPPPVDEEEEGEGEDEAADEEDDESSEGGAPVVRSETESDEETEGDSEEDLAAAEGDVLPVQLGIQKYVFSAYFATAALLAYIIGRAIHDIWAHYASRDFFVNFNATIAGVPDDDAHILNKKAYSLAIGVVVSLIIVVRQYRKPSFRQWIDEVTTELVKCVWPNRKEVTTQTIVVLAASALSTAYLFILDRLWAFITSLVYGTGT